MQKVNAGNSQFVLPKSYTFIRVVGEGGYGTVAAFRDDMNRKVAVKKIANFTDDLVDGRRVIREIRLLQQLDHPCLLSIHHVLPPTSVDFSDAYITSELMDTDLHRVIYSKQPITLEHTRWWMTQLFRGLDYLNKADIVHRDIKPSNLLVNVNCDLKICDFGLARVVTADENLTSYVCTRWYRAPEVIFTAGCYDHYMDMWSAGCVLAELMQRTPLFPGKDHLHQIRLILQRLGLPEEEDRSWISVGQDADKAFAFLDSVVDISAYPKLWSDFPAEDATDLLKKLIRFSPQTRLTAAETLEHPYIQPCAVEQERDKRHTVPVVDWSFDAKIADKQSMKNALCIASTGTSHCAIQHDSKRLGSIRQMCNSGRLSASGA